jgi:hypothetical protein
MAEFGLTREQLDRILAACKGVIVFGPSGDENCVRSPGSMPGPPIHPGCGPHRPLCLRIYGYSEPDQEVLGQGGYVEVTDEQPGDPLCGSEADGVCMRIGASSPAALDRVVEAVTPTETTTPSETSTTPESSTPTTPASTGDETTTPTETTTASSPPTSSDGAEDSSAGITFGTP